ncbi:MAG: hypothetical protein ACREOW_07605 [Thermodesulfobacteriota bacterium]
MRRVHLTRPQDVRRLLSRIINMVLNDEIEVNRANCIGQLCNTLLKSMEMGDLENRLEEVEKQVLGIAA